VVGPAPRGPRCWRVFPDSTLRSSNSSPKIGCFRASGRRRGKRMLGSVYSAGASFEIYVAHPFRLASRELLNRRLLLQIDRHAGDPIRPHEGLLTPLTQLRMAKHDVVLAEGD
jgi:hypothetical protein